jgi:hypothetical protein
MADGSRRPINEVRVGDRVLATDPGTGRTTTQPVTQLWRNRDTAQADVVATGRSGRTGTIRTTADHAFWSAGSGSWVEAADLAPGSRLGAPAVTVGVVRAVGAPTVMYDLTVAEVHTYHVGVGDESVLVHNVTCPIVGLNAAGNVLAQISMHARMVNGVRAGRNVAVYRIGSGTNTRYLAASSEGVDGRHSEEVLDDYIDQNGISWDDVTGVYSERAPCTTDPHYCAIGLNRYRNAQGDIYYSLNPDGVRNGASNAAAIGRAMGDYTGPPSDLPGWVWVN